MATKWRVWGLDVWGNDKDGYEVNDRWEITDDLILPRGSTDRDVMEWLKHAGLLKKYVQLRWLNFEGDSDFIYIEQARNAYPLFQMEKIGTFG